MSKLIFLTEAVLEEEEDLYVLVQKLQSDVSGLKSQLASVNTNSLDLLDVTGDISDKLQQYPTAEQMDYVIAFLFMLVCFELMRLVYRWTKSYKYRGKVGE